MLLWVVVGSSLLLSLVLPWGLKPILQKLGVLDIPNERSSRNSANNPSSASDSAAFSALRREGRFSTARTTPPDRVTGSGLSSIISFLSLVAARPRRRS